MGGRSARHTQVQGVRAQERVLTPCAARMLPQGPVANAGGNVAEADSVVAPQGIPAAVTSGAASVGPRVLGLLAGATLTLALLA